MRGSVHPEYREVLQTYAKHQGMPVAEFGYVAEAGTIDLEDLERKMDGLTGAVIVQSPNFFGIVDQVKAAAEIAHKRGALLVVIFTEAVSLGIAGAAGRRRYRGGRTAIVRDFAELRRPVRGHHRDQGEAHPAGARTAGGTDRPIRAAIARSA